MLEDGDRDGLRPTASRRSILSLCGLVDAVRRR
jgi:hypothetical protein